MYLWTCERCQMQVSLLRSFERYKDPPTDTELGDASVCANGEHDQAGARHKWARDWSHGVPKFVRGPSWGGGKGSWLWLLAFASISLLNQGA